MYPRLFYYSIALNLIFVLLFTLIVYQKGGTTYLKKKVFNLFNGQPDIYNIHNPPTYIHKSSQYEILPQSHVDIIFLGDSITDEGEWVELLNNPNIKNRGISGDTTDRILRRLDSVIAVKPKQIFLMVGINDLSMIHKSVEATTKSYEKILNKFQKATPDTEVFIQSVLPVNNRVSLYWVDNQKVIELNLQLQKLAQKYNYQYIDIFSHLLDSEQQLDSKYTSDGLHLNGQAYLVWKQIIQTQLFTK